jgi:hypothetical protein
MSHVTLRVGRLFSLHTPKSALTTRKPARAEAPAQGVPIGPTSRGRDDLAFFGLCVEVNHDDPRAEMEWLALVSPEAQVWDLADDPRLYLL